MLVSQVCTQIKQPKQKQKQKQNDELYLEKKLVSQGRVLFFLYHLSFIRIMSELELASQMTLGERRSPPWIIAVNFRALATIHTHINTKWQF